VRGVQPVVLVGDGIENPWNAQTMIDAAGMFSSTCLFRDRANLAAAWTERGWPPDALASTTVADLRCDYAPIVACDNLDGALDIYGVRLSDGPRPAVVVGNERHGLAHDMQAIAQQAVQIPMAARTLNCLNVAAASAVALYYLSRGSGPLQHCAHPQKRRPELMMVGPLSHIELGSSIRSAGAFGWERLFVDDRRSVWFGVDRITRSEGRSAARRGRNPIRVIPAQPDSTFAFREVSIITRSDAGVPLHRARLAGGSQHLIVIPDEDAIDIGREEWGRLARNVTFVRVDVPVRDYAYHYRLVATIALAEVARQVGQRGTGGRRHPRHRVPFYDRALELLDQEHGETVFLEDLEPY
jgi:SpoU rRNA Methylase family